MFCQLYMDFGVSLGGQKKSEQMLFLSLTTTITPKSHAFPAVKVIRVGFSHSKFLALSGSFMQSSRPFLKAVLLLKIC